MDSEAEFREGDLLVGKYRLERLLGSGGMGVVYEATQLELERRVAIKLLRPESAESEITAARVLVEARATARLQGPHVAKLLDVGRLDSGAPFLVMEYLQGKNLSEVMLTDGPRSVGVAVRYVLETCEALAEAHRAGIIHRDLKPANLFLARDTYGQPCIKVLDFGISKILDPNAIHDLTLTDSRALIGSPAYMSPEQMRSARDVDHRTDIWSLGAVLFELLTGHPVWTGQSLSELCAQVTRDPCPTLSEACPGIAPELSAIVGRCLAKDPADRYQDVADLALALHPFARVQDRAIVFRVLQLAGRVSTEAVQTTASPSGAAHSTSSGTGRTLDSSVVTASKPRPRSVVSLLVVFGIIVAVGVVLSIAFRSHRTDVSGASSSTGSSAGAMAAGNASQPLPPPSEAPQSQSNAPVPVVSSGVSAPLGSVLPRTVMSQGRGRKAGHSAASASSEPIVDLIGTTTLPHAAPAASAKTPIDPMSIRQ